MIPARRAQGFAFEKDLAGVSLDEFPYPIELLSGYPTRDSYGRGGREEQLVIIAAMERIQFLRTGENGQRSP